MTRETAERLASGALAAARGLARRLPARVRARLDDRLFYAIFQMTRVTNDNYPQRPPEAAPDGEPTAG